MNLRKEYLFLSIVLLSIVLLLSYHKNQQDDAYIYYTYAHNIADGNGYVFNLGERINATTSPLYTLLTALIYYIFSLIIPGAGVPAAGELINAMSLIFAAFALYKIFIHFREERLAYFSPLFFLINPLVKHGAGMESILMIALLLWGIYFYFLNKFSISAVLLALAFLARFDAALFLLILLLWQVFHERKAPPLLSFLVFFVIIIPWFIFSIIYFHLLIPTTIFIKLHQTASDFFGVGLVYLNGFPRLFPGGPVLAYIFLALLSGSFILILFTNKERFKNPFFILIISWTLCHFLIYSFILNTPAYPWYYTPYILLFAIIFSAALEEIYKLLHNKRLFYAGAVIILLSGLILPAKTFLSPFNYKYDLYSKAAEWLNENAGKGSSVMIDEIGIVGYYYRKGKIIDAFGLINPESAKRINEGDYDWTIRQYKPDYIVADYPNGHKYLSTSDSILRSSYSEKAICGNTSKVIIYRKNGM